MIGCCRLPRLPRTYDYEHLRSKTLLPYATVTALELEGVVYLYAERVGERPQLKSLPTTCRTWAWFQTALYGNHAKAVRGRVLLTRT
jgi:hypothetical protein